MARYHYFLNTVTMTHPVHGKVVLMFRRVTKTFIGAHVTRPGEETQCMKPAEAAFYLKSLGIDIEKEKDGQS